MSDNVKLIEDCFAAFGRGDPGYIVARVTDDVEWRGTDPAHIPYGGAYKGPKGVGEFFTNIAKHVEVTRWEPQRVFAAGEEVVATGLWSAKAKSTGRSFTTEWAMLFGFRDGKIATFKAYEDTAAAVAAFH